MTFATFHWAVIVALRQNHPDRTPQDNRLRLLKACRAELVANLPTDESEAWQYLESNWDNET